MKPGSDTPAPIAGNQEGSFIVHSTLDDLPLTPNEFRLYAHAVRRGRIGGLYWESVPKAARHCQVRPDTLRRALKRLLSLGLMVPADKRPGRTWTYAITAPSSWSFQPLPKEDPSPRARAVLKQGDTHPEAGRGTGIPKPEGTPPERGGSKVFPVRHSLEGIPSTAFPGGASASGNEWDITEADRTAAANAAKGFLNYDRHNPPTLGTILAYGEIVGVSQVTCREYFVSKTKRNGWFSHRHSNYFDGDEADVINWPSTLKRFNQRAQSRRCRRAPY
jgi:hypothetical protein